MNSETLVTGGKEWCQQLTLLGFHASPRAQARACWCRREDMSEQHAREARMAFLQCLSRGEGALDLAEAALQVAAEDDALGELFCHSSSSIAALRPACFHQDAHSGRSLARPWPLCFNVSAHLPPAFELLQSPTPPCGSRWPLSTAACSDSRTRHRG